MASKPRGKRAAKAASGAAENVVDDVPVSLSPVSGKNADTKTKPLKETTNNPTLEEELEAMTKALKKVSLEKEQGEALLKAKEEELMAKTLEAERVQEQLNDSVEGKKKLEEKLRKLQKLKEFQPTLVNNFSLFFLLNRVIFELNGTFWSGYFTDLHPTLVISFLLRWMLGDRA